ncbi:DUF3630 family protein [Pseudoalteromonas sp. T1lg65]|uniref:DUF3630 family protein n=1 Tax=Pseudoalteromonas sp. T1lg65 TaxID=2077101 RepID=UPI003F79DAE3
MTQITFDTKHQLLLVALDVPLNDDEFELWGKIFLHHDDIELTEFNQGADRHQWRFNYQNSSFTLNFEHYSESIWVSAEGADAEQKLQTLYTQLLPQK